jgi:hypothetical protein
MKVRKMIPILPGLLPAFLILMPTGHSVHAQSPGTQHNHRTASTHQTTKPHRERESIAGKARRERARMVAARERSLYSWTRKSCHQLRLLWVQNGGSHATENIAAAEGEAESAGRPWATDLNGGASTDKGLWQINNLYHPTLSTYDIRRNVRAAIIISNDGRSWSLWSSYVAGTEHGQCGVR